MNPARAPFVPTLHDGIVSAVDEKTGWVRVRLLDFDNLLTNWLQVLYAASWGDQAFALPDIDAPVAVLLDGSGESGFVLGGYYNAQAPVPEGATPGVWMRRFKDGALLRYDRNAHALEAVLPAGGTALMEAPGGGTLRGDWKVEGSLSVTKDVIADGTITGHTDVIGNGVSLHDHPHGGVQKGGDESGPPT